MTTEQWKPIPSYEDYYAVSDHGRVMRTVEGKSTYAGRILTSVMTVDGYLRVCLSGGRKGGAFSVHRLVLTAFKGERPDMQVNHINGIKTDNRLENLEWVTLGDNIRHAERMGLMPHDGGAKVTVAQAAEIRSRYATGKTSYRKLGAQFGISRQEVMNIVRSRVWRTS